MAARLPAVNACCANTCYFDVFNAKIVGRGRRRLTKQVLEVASKGSVAG